MRSVPPLPPAIRKRIGQQILIGPRLALEAWSRQCLNLFLPQMSVAAVIPILGEAATISRIVAKARRHVDAVIVVDDGSVDATAALVAQAGAEVVVKPAMAFDPPSRSSMNGDLP